MVRRNGGWINFFDAASPRWVPRFHSRHDNRAFVDLLCKGRTSGLALGWF
jgi:hypothetical protein